MVEKAKFFNIKINVDGKIHNVKVEKGLSFNSFFAEADNKIGHYVSENPETSTENTDSTSRTLFDGTKTHLEYCKEVKMTKAEFSIFMNVANNKKENGNNIVLSKADIREAEEMFRNGEFTNDISKNLPKGYIAKEDCQGLEPEYGELNYVQGVITDSESEEDAGVIFREEGAAPILKKAINNSKDGEVFIDYDGEELASWINSYDYVDKDGKKHVTSPYSNYEEVKYEKDGKQVHQAYRDSVLTKQIIEYVEDGKDIQEVYKDGKTTKYITYKDPRNGEVQETRDGNDTLLTKEYGNVKETYENGLIAARNVGGREKSVYENGKLVSKIISISGRNFNFDENGKLVTISYIRNGEQELNIQAATNVKLSDKAKKYRENFKNMHPVQIAKELKFQIDGPSFNYKTLAKIDAIPADKFTQVMKEYQKLCGTWLNRASLFTDLMQEWKIDCWDCLPRLRYAFASYISNKKDADITAQDSEMMKFLYESFDKSQFNEFLQKFEEYITK